MLAGQTEGRFRVQGLTRWNQQGICWALRLLQYTCIHPQTWLPLQEFGPTRLAGKKKHHGGSANVLLADAGFLRTPLWQIQVLSAACARLRVAVEPQNAK